MCQGTYMVRSYVAPFHNLGGNTLKCFNASYCICNIPTTDTSRYIFPQDQQIAVQEVSAVVTYYTLYVLLRLFSYISTRLGSGGCVPTSTN